MSTAPDLAAPKTRPPAIAVRGVTHRFGETEVLSDVSFEVPERSVLGVIGPNGAGKTTTLRVLATLLEPDFGEVYVAGVDVLAAPHEARKVLGFMPDAFGVYDALSVLEYLEFFAGAQDLFGAAQRTAIDASLQLTKMGDLVTKSVGTLSQGTRQRLAIARTLLHDPEVLILDEPANGLDPRARLEMRDLLRELERLGKTVVISSHILSELSEMCSQLLIVERGRVRASGPIADIMRGLSDEQRVRIELLAPMEEPVEVEALDPAIVAVERPSERTLVVRHKGDAAVVARVIAGLVGCGVDIVRVEPETNDLSRIFLEVTKGEIR